WIHQGDADNDRGRNRQGGELALGQMEAVEADAMGDRRAGGQCQNGAEAEQNRDRNQHPAVNRPPPAADHAPVGAGKADHASASASARTRVAKASPRSSKLANWSKDAQAGASNTTAPRCRSRRARTCASSTARARSPARV